jgi:hypothetical protein
MKTPDMQFALDEPIALILRVFPVRKLVGQALADLHPLLGFQSQSNDVANLECASHHVM